MTLSQLRRESEAPAAPLLRRDLQRLGGSGSGTFIVFVTNHGVEVDEEASGWIHEVVSTPSECMPHLGWGVVRPIHLDLINDMDIGEPMTLKEAAELGRQMAAGIGDDLIDVDF